MVLFRRCTIGLIVVLSAICSVRAELKDVAFPDRQSFTVPPRGESHRAKVEIQTLKVDAHEHCVFMTEMQRPDEKAAKINLKPNHHYRVSVSGEAFLSGHAKAKADPFPGVTVFYCTNEQDGFATQTGILKPGDEISFVSPRRKSKDLFLSAFFLDYWAASANRGQYELTIHAQPVAHSSETVPDDSHRILNLNFGRSPRDRGFNGVIGRNSDVWTQIDVGEQHKAALRFADGSGSDVEFSFSGNDGEWGLEGHYGVCHAYLYHNCRCVDLSVTLKYLPVGTYDVYVCAHGDAPDQNAAIEIQSGGTLYSGKSTLNDGSWDFRSQQLKEGNQYVRYTVDVIEASPMVITSKRDGSNLSMFNAIQLRRRN